MSEVKEFRRVQAKTTEDTIRTLQDNLEEVLSPLTNQDDIKEPNLLSGWEHYGDIYRNAGYWKDAMGVVRLTGLIKSGSTTVGDPFFTMPSGYRPQKNLIFATIGNAGAGRIDIHDDGEVVYVSGGNGWLSLDGISFRAER